MQPFRLLAGVFVCCWWCAERGKADSPTAVPAADTGKAADALKPLAARAQDASADRERLRLDLLAFRRSHAGTPAAVQAARLLARLPSPLDQLDAEKIAKEDRFEGQPKELVAVLAGHKRAAAAVAFTADGTALASSSWDNTVRLWKLTGPVPTEWAVLKGSPSGLAFSPDGATLVTGGADSKLHLWDVSGPKPKKRPALSGHTNRPFAVVFSPNGKMLVSACFGPVLRLYDLRGKEPEAWAALVDDDEARAFVASSVAFSADGKTLAAGGYTGTRTLRLWDMTAAYLKELDAPKVPARLVAFSSDGKTLALHGEGGAIRLWHLGDGKPRAHKVLAGHPLPGKSGTVNALAFSPDGKTLASSGQDRKIILWDGASGAKLREWQLPEEAKALAFAPDSRHLATGNDTGDLFILRTAGPR